MSVCSIVNTIFNKYVTEIDAAAAIDKMKDKPLRYNVWETTSQSIKDVFAKGIKSLPKNKDGNGNSPHILKKIKSGLTRIHESTEKKAVDEFIENIINNDENIGMTIALHEVISTIEGEVNKARNNAILINDVASPRTKVLPVIPLSRIAANIGRTISFQMGIRFHNTKITPKTPIEIETLYYYAGKRAIELLVEKKYLNMHSTNPSIKDYTNRNEVKKEYIQKTAPTEPGKHVLSISLNEKMLGIEFDINKPNNTADHFIKRSEAKLRDTKLGVIIDMLGVVRQITQGSTIINPHTSNTLSNEDLRKLDDDNVKPDPISEDVRKDLYDSPLKVNTAVHGLLNLLNKKIRSSKTLLSGSQIIGEFFDEELMASLFGMKNSDNFSIDKKESIGGQNLSKTTPLDDISENYDLIQGDSTDPVDLHMAMFQGRNIRFYYYNSVLNPHGSKHSRATLTAGKQSVDLSSANFEALAYNVWESLGKNKEITFEDIKGETTKFDDALEIYDQYESYIESGKLSSALSELSLLAVIFPGVDYANLLTGLKAIQDIQMAEDGVVTTEFMNTADATASGGTQTIVQAVGTNTEVTELLQRLGMLTKPDGSIEVELSMRDLYAIMEQGIKDFIAGKRIPEFNKQPLAKKDENELTGDRLFMSKTVDLLFDNGSELRNLSKDPTMVFVYKQGESGSIETMASNLADRIVDNLDNDLVREYLGMLLEGDGVDYKTITTKKLNLKPGFYTDIQEAIKDKKVPKNLRSILDATMGKFLTEYNERGDAVWEFIKEANIHKFKALPAGPVLSDPKLMDGGKPSLAYVKEFGMPISKVFEVGNEIPDTNDIVLTREQKLSRPVADVSMIHGIDAAQLYHAISRASKKLGRKLTVITVHDQIIGSAEEVQAVIAEYRNVSNDIAQSYDTHQQLMYAVLAYRPDMAQDEDFTALMQEIDENVAEKKRIMKTQFNENTDSLIGDALAIKEFVKGNTEGNTPTDNKSEKKSNNKEDSKSSNSEVKKVITDGTNDTALFVKLSEKDLLKENEKVVNDRLSLLDETTKKLKAFIKTIRSPLLDLFIKHKGSMDVSLGDMFFPGQDKIVLSGSDGGLRDLENHIPTNLDFNNKDDAKVQKEIIDHEIVHYFTIGYIEKYLQNKIDDKEAIKDFKVVKKSITDLERYLELVEKGTIEPVNEYAHSRILYILGSGRLEVKLAEFLSIVQTEEKATKGILEALNKLSKVKEISNASVLKNAVSNILNAIKKYIFDNKEELLTEYNTDAVITAVKDIIVRGARFKSSKRSETLEYQNQFSERLVSTDGLGVNTPTGTTTDKEKAKGSISYLNYAVASMLNSKLEKGGQKLVGKIHKLMVEVFPMYSEVADKIAGTFSKSEIFGQLYHSITGEGVDKTEKADVLALSSKLLRQHVAIISTQMGKFNDLFKNISKDQKAVIGRFVTEMPLHDYFALADDFVTEEEISSEIIKLEKEIKKSDPKAIKTVNDLISWNVKHEESKNKGKVYNLSTEYAISEELDSDDFNVKVHKLLALKSIQTIGSKDFESFLENTDLVNLIKDTVIANKLSLQQNIGEGMLNDSLIAEYYKENPIIKAIELKDLKRFEIDEKLGWKILRQPTTKTLGIVYMEIIDSTEITGAYTNIKLNSGDIDIAKEIPKYKNTVRGPDGNYKLRLTQQDKIDLGLVDDWTQRLVRSTSHSMVVQESQILRDGVLRKETRMLLGKNNIEKLEDIIKSDNIDNPWVIKFEEGTKWKDMPDSVKAKYKIITNASTVRGFNNEVDLVRKDISFWLMGGSATSLFKNPKYKWMMRITKDLIATAKIGMVVLNPIKIANDNISNISYLSVMGVDPFFVAKNYKSIAKDFTEYSDLQRQITELKIKLVANPDNEKLREKIESLRSKASDNPLGDLDDKGFINSLGSDLVTKNSDNLSGLQADIHTALEYMLLDKDKNKNYISHFIIKLHNIGFQGEGFLNYIGGIANKHGGKIGKGMQYELDQVYKRLQSIRSDEDIVNYVAQYINSPGSEAVKLGASVTDLTDVMAKETLYRHLVENDGNTKEEARIKVLDSFPDYKENMPLAIKQLSDIGIIMFPSFWLRIQKVIYRTARDKPINLATELLLEEAMGSDINTIIDANIINKSNSFGGLLHTPIEPIGLGSVFPTHFFKFLFGWI